MAKERDREGRRKWELYRELIERAWRDEDFKARLQADPAGTLREAGIRIDEELKVRLVEDTNKVRYFHLPLDDDRLIC